MKIELIAAFVVAVAAIPAPPKYGSYSRYWPRPQATEEIEARAAPVYGTDKSYEIRADGKLSRRASPISAETSYDSYAREAEDELERRKMTDDNEYTGYGKYEKVKRANPAGKVADYFGYGQAIEDEIEKRAKSEYSTYEIYDGDHKEKRASPISAESSYDSYAREAENEIEKKGIYSKYTKYA